MGNTNNNPSAETKENNTSAESDAKPSFETYTYTYTALLNDLNEQENKKNNGADDGSIDAFSKFSTGTKVNNLLPAAAPNTDKKPTITFCAKPEDVNEEARVADLFASIGTNIFGNAPITDKNPNNTVSTKPEDVDYEASLANLVSAVGTNILGNARYPNTVPAKPVKQPYVSDDSVSVSLMPAFPPQQQNTNNAFSDPNHNNNYNNTAMSAFYNHIGGRGSNPRKRVSYLSEGQGQETGPKPPVQKRKVDYEFPQNKEFLFANITVNNITVQPGGMYLSDSLTGTHAIAHSGDNNAVFHGKNDEESSSGDSDGNPYPPIYCQACRAPKQWANPSGGRLNSSKIIVHGSMHSRKSQDVNFAATFRGKSYMLPKQNELLKNDYLPIRQEIKKKQKKKLKQKQMKLKKKNKYITT